MERLERGDMEGLEGIVLRRTKGEVTAGKIPKKLRQLIHSGFKMK
jgi:hypothetical protein